MTQPTAVLSRVPGHGGLELAVDRWAEAGGQAVVLLHGGGQTRHAWGGTGAVLAQRGYDVTSVDLRGHGDSGWAEEGDYRLDAFRDDLLCVLDGVEGRAVVIGASLGGIAALLAAAEPPPDRMKALVLVDVTHRIQPGGVSKIQGFMSANREGFATVEEAAEVVAAYLPHRARPPSPQGLMKNLRERRGRLHWHWDPAFLDATAVDREAQDARMARCARAIAIPTLLVRGDASEIVSPQDAQDFLSATPHAELVEVKGAAHMVAGDQNTIFGDALLAFLERIAPPIPIDRRLPVT